MATSYNGWPATQTGSGIDRNFVAAGQKFPGGVRAGGVASVFRWLIEKLNTIEPIVAGWNWGYEYRPNVNNPSTLSCHSSGTAIDYNAPNHPNGARGTWSAAQVAAIRGWLNQLDGVVRWGYDFTGTKDEMHFEIIGSQADVDRVAARLGDPGDPGDDDMPLSDQDINKIVEAVWGRLMTSGISGAQEPASRMLEATNERVYRLPQTIPTPPAAPTVEDIWAKAIKSEITGQNEAAWRTLQAVNTKVFGGPVAPPPVDPTYTVVAGDTLGAIAKKFNVTVADLVAWNGLSDPNNISVGQVLKVGKA